MKRNYFSLVLFLFVINLWSQEYKQMITAGTYTVQEIQQSAESHFELVGRERGKGYNPYKRWEYHAFRNMDENGMLKSPEFFFNELENYNNYLNQNGSEQRTTVGTWEQLGPLSKNATSGWNPGVGRITSIAIEESNTNHMIVGGETGGVWKTTDGANSWTVLTDNLSNINVYALAIDPNNSSVYFWGSTGGTIFKSDDTGSTWNLLAETGTGDVNKILIDPTNSSKMYCSVQGGGIYKSTDSGVNWSLISPSVSTGYDVEFKPGDPDVIYASGSTFYKSTDGGQTFSGPNSLPQWTQEYISGNTEWVIASSNQNNTVSPKSGAGMAHFYKGNFDDETTRLISLSIDLSGAVNPELNFSYANVNWDNDVDEVKVLYRTSMTGAWTQIANYTFESANWTDITLNLPNPSSDYYIAFEGLSNWGRGLNLDDVSVEATNLGVVFQEGFESNSSNQFNNGPKMIGVSSHDPSVVYVLEASGGTFGGFYKSTDSGDSFTELNHAGKNYFGYSSQADDNVGQAPRDMDIAVNPSNVNEIHIAGILTWRSMDGGANFNITSQWMPDSANSENIGYCHADVDIMLFSGTDLFVGTDGGVFVAENTETINTSYFRDLTSGLGIRQFYKIGVSQTDPEIAVGGSQDNGTSVMNTSGNWTDWLGADGMECFVDKTNGSILYGTSQYGALYKSTNGGASYFYLSSPGGSGNWITPFEQDPLINDVIYSAYSSVYKSINGGGSWTSISQNFGGNLDHLKIAPSNSNVLYAARGSSLYRNNFGGLTSWIQLTGFSGSINSIAIHPTNPNKVAIATTGDQKVYVSSDAGTTWTSYLKNLPDFNALALVWQNNASDGLYVGMNYGVYYIDSTFTDWQPFINNLPNVMISELEINKTNAKIYAGTYGRGLWRSNLFDSNLSLNDNEFKNVSIYPNPATNEINISWNRNEDVNVRVFDSSGKIIYFAKKQNLISNFKIDISNFSSGLYFVRINNSKGEITTKIIKE